MTYTPINWQTGDTITAEKMNKMDNGWSVSSTQLLSETVTTVDIEGICSGDLASTEYIDLDNIIVTFNGVDYECSNISESVGTSEYGAPWSDALEGYDFSVFPFNLYSTQSTNENVLITEAAGTYAIKAAINQSEISSGFSTAVQKVLSDYLPLKITLESTTWQEAYDAISAGRIAYVSTSNGTQIVSNIQQYSISCISSSGLNVAVTNYYANSADSPLYSE